MKTKLTTIALSALLFAGLPLASSSAYVGISVAIAPPAIPIYEQPYCPAPGYIWTPGYWDYADFGYYWVPGVWVRPPRIGVLWTPGYWGFRNGVYAFNDGYWGPSVGFYGGINYGFGYGGRGYYGGRWSGNNFQYNTAVTRVNKTVITNNYTYVNKNVKPVGSRAGFNGPKGANLQPTAQEKAAVKDRVPPTEAQQARINAAKSDPALRAKNNNGKPKPEAIQALNKKTGANTAAETGANNNQQNGANKNANEQAGAENQAKADHNQAEANNKRGNGQGQAQAENKTKAAKRATAADENNPKVDRAERHERSAAKAGHADNNSAPQAHRNAQARRNHEMNHPAAAAHPPRQQQAASRQQGQPQTAQGQGPGKGGPARGPQQGKKKKHPDRPDGQ